MLCAAECNEGLQHWSDAETYLQAYSERGQDSTFGWYFYCRRTGKGNVKEARALIQNYVDKVAELAVKPSGWDMLLFDLLEGQPEKAQLEIEKLVAEKPVAVQVLWMALIADQLKDAAKRDAALSQAKLLGEQEGDSPDSAAKGVALAVDLIVKDLAQGGEGQIDVEAVDKIAASLNDSDRFVMHFAIAQYLTLHGRPEAAQPFALRCMGWPRISVRFRTVAGALLVQQGIKPAAYKALLQPAK